MGRFEEKTRYCINENDCIHKSDDNLEKVTIVRGPKTIKLFWISDNLYRQQMHKEKSKTPTLRLPA